MDFVLNLVIESQYLSEMKKSDLKITVAKAVNDGNPNVAWLVFDPFEGNTIEWSEEYGIFVSSDDISLNGAIVKRISEVFPAQDGTTYNFESDCTFHGPFATSITDPKVEIGSFKVKNQMPVKLHGSLTYGLEQKASINNIEIKPSPLNAACVPSMMSATFTPKTKVYVWLQNEYTYGTILTHIESQHSTFEFGGKINRITAVFDKDSARFIERAK